jgi:DNA-directed RNA polymerase subunit K/omega
MMQEKIETEAMTSAELLSRAVLLVGNHYLLCNLLAQRVKQLSDGAPKRVPGQGLTVTEIALREIVGGHLKWDGEIEIA